jgi:hypothetical protein
VILHFRISLNAEGCLTNFLATGHMSMADSEAYPVPEKLYSTPYIGRYEKRD